MTDTTCYNQLGTYCLKRKADCDSDLFHCDFMKNYVFEHTIKRDESKRIELGLGACDEETLKRLEELR